MVLKTSFDRKSPGKVSQCTKKDSLFCDRNQMWLPCSDAHLADRDDQPFQDSGERWVVGFELANRVF